MNLINKHLGGLENFFRVLLLQMNSSSLKWPWGTAYIGSGADHSRYLPFCQKALKRWMMRSPVSVHAVTLCLHDSCWTLTAPFCWRHCSDALQQRVSVNPVLKALLRKPSFSKTCLLSNQTMICRMTRRFIRYLWNFFTWSPYHSPIALTPSLL
jgi:hypothetical protein